MIVGSIETIQSVINLCTPIDPAIEFHRETVNYIIANLFASFIDYTK